MFYFSVITIFPEVLEPYFKTSIIGRAQKKKVIKVQLINPRNFVFNRHRTVDDNPYGGGPGMVMKPEPLIKAVLASKSKIKNQKSFYCRQEANNSIRQWREIWQKIIKILF